MIGKPASLRALAKYSTSALVSLTATLTTPLRSLGHDGKCGCASTQPLMLTDALRRLAHAPPPPRNTSEPSSSHGNVSDPQPPQNSRLQSACLAPVAASSLPNAARPPSTSSANDQHAYTRIDRLQHVLPATHISAASTLTGQPLDVQRGDQVASSRDAISSPCTAQPGKSAWPQLEHTIMKYGSGIDTGTSAALAAAGGATGAVARW